MGSTTLDEDAFFEGWVVFATLVDVDDDFIDFPEEGFDLTPEALVLDEAERVVVDFPKSDVLDDLFDVDALGFDV